MLFKPFRYFRLELLSRRSQGVLIRLPPDTIPSALDLTEGTLLLLSADIMMIGADGSH